MPAIRSSPAAAPVRSSRIRVFLAAAAASALAACATPPVGTHLASTSSAETPVVAVGNAWTYRVRDGYTGLDRGTQRYRVTAVAGDRVNLVVESEQGGQDEMQVYDRQWNWLRRAATNLQTFTYEPAYQAFAFPLVPGKTWRQRLIATDPRDGRRFPVRIDGTVEGWERVKVPAGEFEAIRVRRVVYFDYWEYVTRGGSDMIETEWYAPAVKQSVRRETFGHYVDYNAGSGGLLRTSDDSRDGGATRRVPDDWLIYELVSYTVR